MENKKSSFTLKAIWLIILINGLVWAKSSYGKLSGGTFVDGMNQTLTKFASQNPYPLYKQFLQTVAIPSSNVFGLLVMWGEFFSALAMILGSLCLLFLRPNKLVLTVLGAGLFGAALMNLNFWLASGWTSPSSESLNLLMMAIELVCLGLVFKLFNQRN